MKLSFDDFGSHFIRKLIKYLPLEEIRMAFEKVRIGYVELA